MHGELKQLADLALFAKIVQTGGISRCADDLGMERTTISRRLGTLERTLGVKLLDRTPKYIAVTEAGQRCLEQCELLLESARNAQSLATVGEIAKDTAPLIIGAPPDIIDRYLESRLQAFEDDNPGMKIERRPVSQWNDDTIEAVDLGISLAPLAAGIGWSNTVAYVRQSIFASAEFAARHKPVHAPLDLEALDCILESCDKDRRSWRFERSDKVSTVTVRAKHVVSSLLEAREAALAGLGICRLPHYLCEPYLRSGQMVDLMPDAISEGRDVLFVSPHQRQRKTGIAALRVYLESAFNKEAI